MKPSHTIATPLLDHLHALKGGRPLELDESLFDPPNTDICRKATDFAEGVLPRWAVNHCFRTYAFAIAVCAYAGWDVGAKANQLGFDKELIFLATILHDLGWDATRSHKSRLSFELWGAFEARTWLMQQSQYHDGLERRQFADWADEVCESIARHTIEVRGFSSHIRLVTACVVIGAAQDLFDHYGSFVHRKNLLQICERWPRLKIEDELPIVMQGEANCKPGCLNADGIQKLSPTSLRAVSAYAALPPTSRIPERHEKI